MRKHIKIGERSLDYTLNFNSRARNLKISIKRTGEVRLTMPKVFFAERTAEKFIIAEWDWIFDQLKNAKPKEIKLGEFDKYKEIARAKIERKVVEFNKIYNHNYGRISIKRTSSRWCSCSSKGNLNFHYKLIFMTEEMMNYVVVHELCHLKELNHSKNFWNLVEVAIPDYKRIVKDFKKMRI